MQEIVCGQMPVGRRAMSRLAGNGSWTRSGGPRSGESRSRQRNLRLGRAGRQEKEVGLCSHGGVRPEVGLGQPRVGTVMPSNPEVRDLLRKCWRGRGGWGGNSLPVSWGHREGSRRDCSTRIKGWGLMWLL